MDTTRYCQTAIGIILLILSSSIVAYSRDDYPHWIDSDHDGQDTREEILIRDSLIAVTFDEEGKVKSGLWVCPYTGKVIKNPSKLDIDHLVALGEIDAAGGSEWPIEIRTGFANDPDNLVAVYGGTNRSKGDRDAVWSKYDIQIDANEKKSVKFFKDKCPKHEKGIKLNRVRWWLGSWFDGLF